MVVRTRGTAWLQAVDRRQPTACAVVRERGSWPRWHLLGESLGTAVALRSDSDPDAGVNPANCGATPPSQRGGSAPNPQLIIGGAVTSREAGLGFGGPPRQGPPSGPNTSAAASCEAKPLAYCAR